jgi:hypothetical protein
MDIWDILILTGLATVSIILCFGLYALFRGGDFGRSNSNKLMRLRVLAQFITVLIIVAAFYFHRH